MSRSDHAQILSRRPRAAIGCMFALVAGCRLATNPGDGIVVADAGASDRSREREHAAASGDDASVPLSSTSSAPAAGEAAPAGPEARDAGSTPSTPTTPAAAAAESNPTTTPTTSAAGSAAAESNPTTTPTTPGAGSSAPATAPTATSTPMTAAGSAATHSPPSAAGGPAAQSPEEAECAAELANCLLRDPLAYAKCLRTNQDNGCPEPDAGVPQTTVTTEDGKPLSQACQAELASCIMRLPTPENAASCTEKARTCK